MFGVQDYLRFLPFKNASGETAPASAALEVTGYDADTGAILATRPTLDSLPSSAVLINGPVDVPAGGYGQATQADPVLALISGTPDPTDDAANSLGTVTDQWHLLVGNTGFLAWSADDDADGLALVQRAGGGAASAAVRISGRPYRVGTAAIRHYPGVVRAPLGDPTTFADTSPAVAAWVVNVNAALMGTTGDFVVEANPDGAVTVNDDTRPRYWTTDSIVMRDFNCDTQQATYTGLWEGDVLGPNLYPDDIFPSDIFPKPLFP